jgi:hypothetical protein
MKKIFAIVLGVALLASTNAFAQFSVGAGWLNTTETEVVGNNSNKAQLNGFYVGGQYKLPIVAGLSVAPGLYASMLFANASQNVIWGGIQGTAHYKDLAINVPVNFAYTIEIGDFEVFAYLGPNFQYAILGQLDTTTDVLGAVSASSTKDLYSGDNKVRNPFNIYFGGGAGFQAGNFQVILGYDHSLTNMSSEENVKLSRSQIKIGVGYAF